MDSVCWPQYRHTKIFLGDCWSNQPVLTAKIRYDDPDITEPNRSMLFEESLADDPPDAGGSLFCTSPAIRGGDVDDGIDQSG